MSHRDGFVRLYPDKPLTARSMAAWRTVMIASVRRVLASLLLLGASVVSGNPTDPDAGNLSTAAQCPLGNLTAAGATTNMVARPARQQVGEEHAIATVETAHPYLAARGTVHIEEIQV